LAAAVSHHGGHLVVGIRNLLIPDSRISYRRLFLRQGRDTVEPQTDTQLAGVIRRIPRIQHDLAWKFMLQSEREYLFPRNLAVREIFLANAFAHIGQQPKRVARGLFKTFATFEKGLPPWK